MISEVQIFSSSISVFVVPLILLELECSLLSNSYREDLRQHNSRSWCCWQNIRQTRTTSAPQNTLPRPLRPSKGPLWAFRIRQKHQWPQTISWILTPSTRLRRHRISPRLADRKEAKTRQCRRCRKHAEDCHSRNEQKGIPLILLLLLHHINVVSLVHCCCRCCRCCYCRTEKSAVWMSSSTRTRAA